MSKRIDETKIMSELSTSAFFAPVRQQAEKPDAKPLPTPPPRTEEKPPQQRDTVVAHAQSVDPSDLIKHTRSAVKKQGKEAAFYRFMPEEKAALADLIHAYRVKGMRTSENEVVRICLNYLLEEYRLKPEKSVIARVLDQLHS